MTEPTLLQLLASRNEPKEIARQARAVELKPQLERALGKHFAKYKKSLNAVANKDISLTDKQWLILFLAAMGYTNAEIGNELNITKQTVAVHLRRVMKKIDVHNRALFWALIFN